LKVIPLTPDMRSEEAARIILRRLLQVIRTNEAHLAQDRDTEILHDFRVAIRRTRSALRQMKNVFPVEIANRFRKDFSFVGNLSNELRDLDVHLQKEGPYKARLPPGLHCDIDPLFDYLREKRAKAFREFLRQLGTRKYKQIFRNWDLFLNGPRRDSAPSSNADLPVIRLARKRIYKRYRGILKDGNEILDNTEDGKLHRLRIECKELRYLLEFFSRLFPQKTIRGLIGQLKKLQDILGEFNDFRVEEQHLQDIAGELAGDDSQSKKTAAAIGRLIKALEREKQTAKKAFANTFSDYASASNRKVFQELFNPGCGTYPHAVPGGRGD
jgi:CHAD domain-containing protein